MTRIDFGTTAPHLSHHEKMRFRTGGHPLTVEGEHDLSFSAEISPQSSARIPLNTKVLLMTVSEIYPSRFHSIQMIVKAFDLSHTDPKYIVTVDSQTCLRLICEYDIDPLKVGDKVWIPPSWFIKGKTARKKLPRQTRMRI